MQKEKPVPQLGAANCRRRLERRQRAAAVPLHLAQVFFQAVGAAHAAADVHAGGAGSGNCLCGQAGRGSRGQAIGMGDMCCQLQ